MGAIVYTTAGGARFHADRQCQALRVGQDLSAQDCGCYEFCTHRLPTTHLPRGRWPVDAARAGFTACRVCVPAALALPATGETYGHEPVIETGYYGYELVCARCTAPRIVAEVSMPWPCTSAVVLGLVITDAERWNERYPVGTPVATYSWTRTGDALHTTTRTPAWRLGTGDSVVSVDGLAGGILLTHVDPL